MPKTKKFPKTLFVVASNPREGDFYIADTDADGYDDGESVAVYELVAHRKKRVVHSLEKK